MYTVAPGYAFTSRRGMLKEGDKITEKDFVSCDIFAKAVAKKKIIVSKDNETLAAEQKAVREGKKEKALRQAKEGQETATAALSAAREMLAAAELGLEAANTETEKTEAEAKIVNAKKAVLLAENDLAAAKGKVAALEGE